MRRFQKIPIRNYLHYYTTRPSFAGKRHFTELFVYSDFYSPLYYFSVVQFDGIYLYFGTQVIVNLRRNISFLKRQDRTWFKCVPFRLKFEYQSKKKKNKRGGCKISKEKSYEHTAQWGRKSWNLYEIFKVKT